MKEEKIVTLCHDVICFDCAMVLGGEAGGCHTSHAGECPYCREQKSISTITDYYWPKEYGIKYVWD